MEENMEKPDEAGTAGLDQFWDKVDQKPYIDAEMCIKFGIKFLKLEKFSGLTEDREGLIFEAKVVKGKLDGQVKELRIYGKRADTLGQEFGTRNPGKWIGSIIAVSIRKKGAQSWLEFNKYEELNKPPAQGGSSKEDEIGAYMP
ncbi:MAG: hypothetical protein WC350_06030 [Candidatus Micrarchaeia archaeon]